MSEFETLLTALLNGETVDFEPKSRIEKYLKNCCDRCGCEGLPTPTTRAEALLYQLAEQLAGGGGGSGATAYHLPSVNDLPASAVNGSIAIVDTPHYLLGTWRFNSAINNMPFNSWNAITFECDGVIYTTLAAYGSIQFYTPSGDEVTVYINGTWVDEKYQTIKIIEGSYHELAEWLSSDAYQVEGATSHTIYYRENGKWAYKGTTSEAISAEYY